MNGANRVMMNIVFGHFYWSG